MKRTCLAAMAIAAIGVSAEECRPGVQSVTVYTLADSVPYAVLWRAQYMAGRVLAGAKVTVKWQKGERSWDGQQEFCGEHLTIAFDAKATPGYAAQAMAYTRMNPGSWTEIHIFYDRVSQFPDRARMPEFLGHVLAHEIAHVLEGVVRHSSDGVMKARWTDRDCSELVRKPLPFAAEDVDLIRSRFRHEPCRPRMWRDSENRTRSSAIIQDFNDDKILLSSGANPMDGERWRQIEEIYHSAAERKPEELDTFLAAACAGDEELRREVKSLLAQQSKGTPLDRPAWELAAGGRLGPYELLEPIGSGGMGTVFKARDTRLNRNVAIKISAAAFSSRFATESRAIAALNHPHVCTLHDVGPNYLVMEFVEGETLAQRLAKGVLPLDQTLRCGVELADAVAAAHAHGIIHRDLKPANIMLTESGVKVLDFGLAKLERAAVANQKPTASYGIVGTAAYMSPEQAAGKPVDARSDIFSLGAVLYEMATGKRPFQRDTDVATLAAIVHEEPEPVSKAAPGASAELERIIVGCLCKDPARRFQTAADLKVELEQLNEESDSGQRHGATVPARTRRRLWVGAIVVAGLLLAAAAWRLRQWAAPSDVRAEVLTSYAGIEFSPSFSPDGNKVAFSWNGEKEDNFDIYVRQIGPAGTPMRLTTHPYEDTAPAWSPDDRWIAFLRLERERGTGVITLISPLGGPERKLVEVIGYSTLSWAPDAKWLAFSTADSQTGPFNIWAVSVETGERRRFTTFVSQSASHGATIRLGDRNPAVSPDGRTLAFTRQAKSGGFELCSLRLTADGRPSGEPSRITGQQYSWVTGIAWTADGREIVYGAGSGSESESLWRVPVSGLRAPRRLSYALPSAVYPAIARRQHRLAYTWSLSNTNLWRMDVRTGQRTPFVGSSYEHLLPQYSPDGRKIAFQSNRTGTWEVWSCAATGSNCQQLTRFGGTIGGAAHWSPDSQWLALDWRTGGPPEIFVIAADGGPLRRVTDHAANDIAPSWSRNGQWIYFASDRTGRYELWRVPKEGGQAAQVTRSGGFAACESPDGKYIYYAKWLRLSQPQSLFRMPAGGGEETPIPPKVDEAWDYSVTSKGVYFSPDSKTIRFFDLATGKASTLAVLDKRIAGGLTASPDDAYLVWSQRDRVVRDLMLVENFR
jgi:Tol biopolymer transport system component